MIKTAYTLTVLALAACGPVEAETGTLNQTGSVSAEESAAPYRGTPFCKKGAEVLNFAPVVSTDVADLEKFTVEHSSLWKGLADESDPSTRGIFLDVAAALEAALEAHVKTRAQGIDVSERDLERARQSSYRLVVAWEAASRTIESTCGWPRDNDSTGETLIEN